MHKIKSVISLCLLLIIGDLYAGGLKSYPLHDGINEVDLNGDGIVDKVILAYFNNQTTHYNQSIQFLIGSEEGSFYHLPISDKYQLILFDNKISVLNYKMIAFQVFQQDDQFILIIATKEGDDMLSQQPVNIDFWHIEYEQEQPGLSPYLWRKYQTYKSNNRYYSAEEAFNEIQ